MEYVWENRLPHLAKKVWRTYSLSWTHVQNVTSRHRKYKVFAGDVIALKRKQDTDKP